MNNKIIQKFRTKLPLIAATLLLLTGCATQSLQTHRGSHGPPENERTALAGFQFPFRAGPDQIVVFVVHMQEDRDKPYRKIVGYGFDNNRVTMLPSEEYSVHVFTATPKALKLDGICNDSEKFETRKPSNGVISLDHPYALRRQAEVDVSGSFQLGQTYVVKLSPFCFKNIYAGGLLLSKGSAVLMNEEQGKYLIFKSKKSGIFLKADSPTRVD